MNKIYKVVWNNTLQCYTVVSELAKSHTKNNASKVVKATVLSSDRKSTRLNSSH